MILLIIALIALVIGTYTDIKTREVPDWLNYSLIFIGLGSRLIFSLIKFDFSYIIEGLFGFGVFLVLALVMFYTGQWGGGDSKMLMGLGALIGLSLKVDSLLVAFFVNALFIGAVYGLIYSFVLAFSNWKRFFKEWKKVFSKKMLIIRRVLVIFSIVLLLFLFFITDYFIRLLLTILILLVLAGFYAYVFVRSVENSCMFKYVKPNMLTEGDWIAKDVKVNGKRICGPKDLGIEKKNIKKLVEFYNKGKVRKILIKVGIPFVPAFLIAFLVSLYFGNVVLLFV